MNGPWAIRLSAEYAAVGARFRLRPGIEVLRQESFVWLRGLAADESIQKLLMALPTEDLFALQKDGQLVRAGQRIPSGYLPTGDWQSARSFFEPALPPAGFAALLEQKYAWSLRRMEEFREPNVLVTQWQHWYRYATSAPQVRLQDCRFAINDAQLVVIRGKVLPPLPGDRCVEVNGVATEAGWTWQLPYSAHNIFEWLGGQPGGLILLHCDGTADFIHDEEFVAATRSAVRETHVSVGANHE